MNTNNPLIKLDSKLDYQIITADDIKKSTDYWVGELEKTIQNIHKIDNKEINWQNTALVLLNAQNNLNKSYLVSSHLNNVNNNSDIQNAHEYALLKVQKITDKLEQDKTIYKKLCKLNQNPNLQKEQVRFLNLQIKNYEKQGVHLSSQIRKKLTKINQQLATLGLRFEQNIQDDANRFSLLIQDKKKLKGLALNLIENFKNRATEAEKKGYLIELNQPNVIAILQNANNRSLRKKIHKAWSSRASSGKFDNTSNIEKTLKLRNEKANLLGFDDYCDYVLSDRMAKNTKTINQLLNKIGEGAQIKAKKEIKAIAKLAKKSLGYKKIKSYDIGYLCQKLKEKQFGFSDEQLRDYFPLTKVLNGLFEICENLYSIQFVESHFPSWNEKVKSFEIYKNNNLIGILYADFYARKTKRSGAWMSEYQCYLNNKNHNFDQIPVAYINMNFLDTAENENYLTFEDVLTLFHETGHSLHHLLTDIGLLPISGINSVQWDAVELPSQIMENFCYNWHYLQKMTAHKKTGNPLDLDLFEKIIESKNQFSGLFLIRQLIFALFDLNIHSQKNAKKWQKILKGLRKKWLVFKPEDYESLAHSFSHIFGGGYASGYYSYLWADILASDAYGYFVEKSEIAKPAKINSKKLSDSVFAKTANQHNGKQFLQNILSQGAIKDANELFYDFRNREPNSDYLFESYGMK